MKYFVGVVPAADVSDAIYQIQIRFGNNRLEPHITVRPPVALTDETKWIDAIQQFAKRFSPFKVQLTNTGKFGKGVLFIEVVSPGLADLNLQLTDSLKPFEQKTSAKKEEPHFHPHLTLGRIWCGFTQQGFTEMEVLSNDFLNSSVEFDVEFLRIYCKAKSNEPYKILMDVQLMKRS